MLIFTFSSSSSSPLRISAYDFRRAGSWNKMKFKDLSSFDSSQSEFPRFFYKGQYSHKEILTPAWNLGFLWSSLAAVFVRASK